MTVNERLYVSGLIDEFDEAVRNKDIKKLEFILKTVELNEESVVPVLESLGLKVGKKDNE